MKDPNSMSQSLETRPNNFVRDNFDKATSLGFQRFSGLLRDHGLSLADDEIIAVLTPHPFAVDFLRSFQRYTLRPGRTLVDQQQVDSMAWFGQQVAMGAARYIAQKSGLPQEALVTQKGEGLRSLHAFKKLSQPAQINLLGLNWLVNQIGDTRENPITGKSLRGYLLKVARIYQAKEALQEQQASPSVVAENSPLPVTTGVSQRIHQVLFNLGRRLDGVRPRVHTRAEALQLATAMANIALPVALPAHQVLFEADKATLPAKVIRLDTAIDTSAGLRIAALPVSNQESNAGIIFQTKHDLSVPPFVSRFINLLKGLVSRQASQQPEVGAFKVDSSFQVAPRVGIMPAVAQSFAKLKQGYLPQLSSKDTGTPKVYFSQGGLGWVDTEEGRTLKAMRGEETCQQISQMQTDYTVHLVLVQMKESGNTDYSLTAIKDSQNNYHYTLSIKGVKFNLDNYADLNIARSYLEVSSLRLRAATPFDQEMGRLAQADLLWLQKTGFSKKITSGKGEMAYLQPGDLVMMSRMVQTIGLNNLPKNITVIFTNHYDGYPTYAAAYDLVTDTVYMGIDASSVGWDNVIPHEFVHGWVKVKGLNLKLAPVDHSLFDPHELLNEGEREAVYIAAWVVCGSDWETKRLQDPQVEKAYQQILRLFGGRRFGLYGIPRAQYEQLLQLPGAPVGLIQREAGSAYKVDQNKSDSSFDIDK